MGNIYRYGALLAFLLMGFFCGAWMQAKSDLKRPGTVVNSQQNFNVKKSPGITVAPDMSVALVRDTASVGVEKRGFLRRMFKKRKPEIID